jgi:activator of HSP90 ATPase
VTVKITSLDECSGDVDLNQRKGKLLAIYDVALKLSWEGKKKKKKKKETDFCQKSQSSCN